MALNCGQLWLFIMVVLAYYYTYIKPLLRYKNLCIIVTVRNPGDDAYVALDKGPDT
jgi:hypothetical protein